MKREMMAAVKELKNTVPKNTHFSVEAVFDRYSTGEQMLRYRVYVGATKDSNSFFTEYYNTIKEALNDALVKFSQKDEQGA